MGVTRVEVPGLMAPHQLHLNSLQTSHGFAVKTPCPSSATLKIKTILQTYIFHHLGHVVRTVANAKSKFMELMKKSNAAAANYSTKMKKRKKQLFRSKKKTHRNWSSSHVIPMPEPKGFDASHMYYDSTWNSMISTEVDEDMEPPLSGYLQWLEEKEPEELVGDDDGSEIDRLAEKFIAKCHEKFRLEKVESYRRYQEMLARSL